MIARILTILLALTGSANATDMKVVTSLKPVHSLTSAIMGELGTPALLISGGASPHTFSLKPSHARALANADLIIWIGPALERFLEAPLANLASNARSMPLMETEGITLLEARSGGIWQGLESTEHDLHDGHDDHDAGSMDPHIWLDTSNAIAITHAIEAGLSETYPAHAANFATNAQNLRGRLENLDKEIRALTQPLTDRPYLVFHDAYQYFENRYGLSPLGAVTTSPDIRPGARRLNTLNNAGKEQDNLCVFAEPQFDTGLLQIFSDRDGNRLAYLDPLGSDIPSGPDQYVETMRALATTLTGCLEASHAD